MNQTINTIKFTGEYQKIGVKSPAWQDLHALVNAAVKHTALGPVVLKNQIPHGIEIYSDPLIEKVFSNLIENAVRYGKKLTVIGFKIENHGIYSSVICEDDGMGIPAEEKEKIFAYEYGMNTGLGLSLSREILAITGITIR